MCWGCSLWIDGLPVLQDVVCVVKDCCDAANASQQVALIIDVADQFGVAGSGVSDDLSDPEFGFVMDTAEVGADPE